MKDISKEAFLQPNNGDQVLLPPTDINEEYTLSELFGDEESTLYSGIYVCVFFKFSLISFYVSIYLCLI